MKAVTYTKHVFDNGVRLILVPMEGVESVATSVLVAVGSRYETLANNGVSHFLEHMVFKGTKKYPTTDDVNVIERMGGLQNAYTDIDITNFHNKVLGEDWELGLEINKELSLYPRLEAKHVDRERNVILEEMKRYEDEPAAKAEEVFHTMMYPDTQLGMRTIGEVDSLKRVDGKELRRYHDTWYQPEGLVIILAGKVGSDGNGDDTAKIIDLVHKWFGSLPEKKAGAFDTVAKVQSVPKVIVTTKKDAQQAHFVLGMPTFPRGSDERFVWNVFNLLMGVSFTSRLFREIREKRGLCYHIRSTSNNWIDTGYWSVYAGVATDKVSEALKAVMEELSKAVDKGITQEEVDVAKKRLKTILAFKSEDPEFLNEYYGRQELFREPIVTLEEYLERVESVTRGEIDALLRKYFLTGTLNLSLVWNKPKDPKLMNLLKI